MSYSGVVCREPHLGLRPVAKGNAQPRKVPGPQRVSQTSLPQDSEDQQLEGSDPLGAL